MATIGKAKSEAAWAKEWLDYVYGERLINRVQNILKKAHRYGVTISTAESLTAGALSQLIAAVDWLGGNKSDDMGVLIAGDTVYSDLAKHELLRVDQHTLAEHTAVSAAVAKEMAEGVIRKTGTDEDSTCVSVSLTGYAGLSNYSHKRGEDAKMGTVFVGVGYRGTEIGAPDISSEAVKVSLMPWHRALDVHCSVVAGVCALEAGIEAFLHQTPIDPAALSADIDATVKGDPWFKKKTEGKYPGLLNRDIRRFTAKSYKALAASEEDPILRGLLGVERIQRFDRVLYEIAKTEAKRTSRPLVTFSGDETIGLMGPLLTMQEGVARILESGVVDARNIFDDANEIARHFPDLMPGVINSARESALQELNSSDLSEKMQTSVSHIAMSAWRISPDKTMPTGEPSIINIAFAVKDPDGTIRLISGDIEIRNRAGHYEASLATADAMLALLEQEFIPQGHIAADKNLRRYHSEAMAKIRNLHTEIL